VWAAVEVLELDHCGKDLLRMQNTALLLRLHHSAIVAFNHSCNALKPAQMGLISHPDESYLPANIHNAEIFGQRDNLN